MSVKVDYACCFIREGLACGHICRVYEFNSGGVTDDSETHYHGITAVAVTLSSRTYYLYECKILLM